MLFASFDFLIFLLPVLAVYWLLAGQPRARLLWLTLTSYFFYMASSKPSGGELPTPWYFAGLILGSTIFDYTAALLIGAARERGSRGHVWFGLSLAGNLGLLGYFKYSGFLAEVANELSAALGMPAALPTLRLALPIGISFYTFQSLSYTIDVWRGRLSPERSLLHFATFIAFFPQLVAGPIVRAADFLPQLRQRLAVTEEDVNGALFRISKGLVKKVLLGDFIAASFTDVVFASPGDYSTLENLLALYGFSLQIYADFSGYSDIAIGVARLLGFRLPENFDRPYQASSVAEFWRRWHMTLSTWLRDYLFFPLGGSRGGPGRAYFNLWLTMFLVGMWHGASWNFVIYANLQGAAMLFNRWRSRRAGSWQRQALESVLVTALLIALAFVLSSALDLSSSGRLLGLVLIVSALLCALPNAERWPWLMPLHIFLTFHFSTLSRVFFRADNLENAQTMVSRLLELDGLGVRPGLFRISSLYTWLEPKAGGALGGAALACANVGVLLLLVLGLGYHFTPARWLERPLRSAIARAPALLVALALAVLMALFSQLLSGPRANIYFSF